MISIYTKEGLVMASSRLETNKLFSGSKNNVSQKCIFKTVNDIGISVYGNALYDYENIIESFILLNQNENINVTEFAHKFNSFLQEMELLSELCFHVGGYEKSSGKKILKVYKIIYPEGKIQLLNTDIKDSTVAGVAWSGEENVIEELEKPLYTIDFNGDYVKLPQFSMPWELFNLDEAIDAAYFTIKKSNEIKYKNISYAMEVTPVDLLVITPKKAEWLSFNNPDVELQELVHTC